ncbi:sensor histidine kinase [Nocardia sp. alder85J]|uniref:sensor histidine kinase n=1 Tax=Nocardia sp. alder85J TaxID=2862949 RepID=UPI001CD75363|nr:HAMP domain-containing sensor histidine kinase [Nocardia sp. alder85J]MCX4098151.1 HAMP domain-containing sensor histidine kinase [Nocardia sp. alder85J]
MCSSRPAESGRRRGFWRPRHWSLRLRLLAGQVLLLVAVVTGVGAVTEIALQQFLVHQLDVQLYDLQNPSLVDVGGGPRLGPRPTELPWPPAPAAETQTATIPPVASPTAAPDTSSEGAEPGSPPPGGMLRQPPIGGEDFGNGPPGPPDPPGGWSGDDPPLQTRGGSPPGGTGGGNGTGGGGTGPGAGGGGTGTGGGGSGAGTGPGSGTGPSGPTGFGTGPGPGGVGPGLGVPHGMPGGGMRGASMDSMFSARTRPAQLSPDPEPTDQPSSPLASTPAPTPAPRPAQQPRVSTAGPSFLHRGGIQSGSLGAIINHGVVTSAGRIAVDGTQADLSALAKRQLAEVPADSVPVTVGLDGAGRYRVIADPTWDGTVVVTGLPMAGVDAILMRALVVTVVVTAVALSISITLGVWLIRRSLNPLTRVAVTAARVADLRLDRGEVALPVRVPAGDADPATEVGRLGEAVNRMLDHIADALSSRHASETRVRQFLADASHELRTPLAAIRGYTELAQRDRHDMSAQAADAMARVDAAARRMSALVEDMLLLARLDSGRSLEREPVDLTQLTVDAISDAHIAGRGHRWDLDLPDEPVVVAGDSVRLHQVLSNLLTNARVHTPPGTTVTVGLDFDGDGAVWRVCDDGPGIPKTLQHEVFERFARGDTSRSRQAGSTGLGLAIVAAVVKAHDGTIDVHSVPGATTFTVRLPGRAAPVAGS